MQTISLARVRATVCHRWHASYWNILILSIIVCSCAAFLYAVPLRDSRILEIGNTDDLTVTGFEYARTDAKGRGFRWTRGDGSVQIESQGIGLHLLSITLDLPNAVNNVPVTFMVNDVPIMNVVQPATPRRYYVLVDERFVQRGENQIRIVSPTFQPQQTNAQRIYGVAVYEVGWQVLSAQPWLVPMQLMSIGLACALLLALLTRAGVPMVFRCGALLLFVALVLAMRQSDTRFIYRVNAIIGMLVLSSLFAGTLLAFRRVPRPEQLPRLRDWLKLHWYICVSYTVVTMVMLFPLILHFSTHIAGTIGDSYEFLWKIQWFHDALVQQHVSPLFAPQILLPTGFDLSHTDIAPTQTLLMLPVTHFFGPIVSYNLAVLLSFVLSGFFTYLLARRLGASAGPAWVAGLLFAFCTRHIYHLLAGHLNLTAIQWIPLALYGWEGVLTRRRLWDGFVAGLGLGLSAWASWYYAPTLAGLLAAYMVLRMGRNITALIPCWRAILLTGVVALALSLPLAQPYIEARSRGETQTHSLAAIEIYSAVPSDYFAPNVEHPLWGQWARQFIRDTKDEHLVAPGYTMMVLAIVGIWLARKRGTLVQTLVVLMIINVILTFGPKITLPNGSAIVLPVRFIHDYVPVLNGLRTWSRMALYVMLCGALLASFSLSAVPVRWRNYATVIATACVLIEYAAFIPLYAPVSRTVDAWLYEQPNIGAVIQFPRLQDGVPEYYSLFNGKPTLSWHGAFDPPIAAEYRDTLNMFPDVATMQLVQRWGAAYIIVNEGILRQTPEWRTQLNRSRLIRQVYRNPWYRVYKLMQQQ